MILLLQFDVEAGADGGEAGAEKAVGEVKLPKWKR